MNLRTKKLTKIDFMDKNLYTEYILKKLEVAHEG